MKNVALLVHSGDKSRWAWKYWHHYWKKFWKSGDIADTIFLGENETLEAEGIISMKTGPCPWGEGLMKALKTIEADIIIYQHEDYFIDEDTNPDTLKELVRVFTENQMKLLKCCGLWCGYMDDNHPQSPTEISVTTMGSEECLSQYNNGSAYLISHQTSLWDREFLYSTIDPNWSPWEHELTGTDQLRSRQIPIYSFKGKCPIPYAETIVHGTVRPGCERFFSDVDKETG